MTALEQALSKNKPVATIIFLLYVVPFEGLLTDNLAVSQ